MGIKLGNTKELPDGDNKFIGGARDETKKSVWECFIVGKGGERGLKGTHVYARNNRCYNRILF